MPDRYTFRPASEATKRGGDSMVDWAEAIGTRPEEAADRVYGTRPDWVTGCVSHLDARYLLLRTLAAETDVAIEIGTASGVSTAVVCKALAIAHGAGTVGDAFQVRTYDLLERFYADERWQTGQATEAMLPPDLASHIVFRNPVTAAAVGEDLGPDAVELMFVDANHSHPWPALDLLATLDALRPGAEVILHDINLPARHPDAAVWGAKHLFDGLDVRKEVYDADAIPNIGSVWIPDDKEALRQQLIALVHAHEWETSIPDDLTTKLLGGG
jgi:predicted O-methyltransferase YrrM